MIEYVADTYQPDLFLVGMPTTDEFQHQFLGLVTQDAAGRRPEPGVRRRQSGRRQGRPGPRARRLHAHGLPGVRPDPEAGPFADRSQPDHVRRRPTTASRPSSWPSTPARCWWTWACSRAPQTSNCRLATGETIGKAKACWAGGTVQVYLEPGRPRPGGSRAAAGGGGRRGGDGRARSRRPSSASATRTTGPVTASPRAGRSSTAPSPRRSRATSPTGRARPPTWPTRPGPATSSPSPTRPTSSTRRPRARSSRRRTSSASTGTCPTCRTWTPT